jgi:death-on-curing protein
MMKFLSAEEIVVMHEKLLELYGGEEGGGHRGAGYEGVEATVQAVNNSYYEALEELAAAYAVYIVQGHVFMDGNKRSASASMLTFLVANGQTPKLSMEDTAPIMLELQQRAETDERVDPDLLIQWLAGFLR